MVEPFGIADLVVPMMTPTIAVPMETSESLVTVLDLVRSRSAKTRPDLVQLSSLGRATVAQRVAQLLSAGLLEESANAASTGGRPARELRFRAGRPPVDTA